jgi:ankyrin repeat protein
MCIDNDNEDLFYKSQQIIELVEKGLEADLRHFLKENEFDLIRILTNDFTIYGNETECSDIYSAAIIFKDCHIKSVEIILNFIEAMNFIDQSCLLKWCLNCASNNAINILKLIYEINSHSYSNFSTTTFFENMNHNQNAILIISNEAISRKIIHHAAESGSIEVMEFLMNDFQVNINALNELEATPLIMAVSGSNLESVKFLIDRGANPNIIAVECLIMYVGALSLSIFLEKWDITEYLYPLVSHPDELDTARILLSEKLPLEGEFNFYDLLNLTPRWE